ncbi:MAG: glycine--tRNA ligase subunit beta [Caldilineaceae bacterium]
MYAEQRQRAEYPWLQDSASTATPDTVTTSSSSATAQSPITNPQSLLLELGSEELPAADVQDGIAQITMKLAELLEAARLDYGSLHVTGTPRRLVAYVTDLATHQHDEMVEKKGPPADRAFDAAGEPTRAATGFARGQGIDVSELEVRDSYVWAVTRLVGQPTVDVLPGVLTDLLNGLRWGKTMRWNATNTSYPRPLRWIVALYGDQVIPFTWAGVTGDRVSRGPRFRDAAADLPLGGFTTFVVPAADAYFDAVAAQGIVLDRQDRRQRIAEMVQATGAAVKGQSPQDPGLLDEVTDLVESPTPVLGSFEATYLDLPKPVLIGVMKKHQRYFPVEAADSDGEQLMPYFVTIANADTLAHEDVVRRGNEGVIRARYADAAYFYRHDTAQPLANFTPRLDTLTFHVKLGSMLDKVHRLEKLAPQIVEMLGASVAEKETAAQAAALCKSDLVTSMVVEMTSLQGVMGEIYARKSGESADVAQAIREHYLPRFAGDANPDTLPGLALSLADKLDSLAGLFGVGVQPSGSADPFGLRRAGLGIVNNLLAAHADFSVDAALKLAASHFSVDISEQALNEAAEFITRRLQGVLLEMGYANDVVEAVLAVRGNNPFLAERACAALSAMVAQPDWSATFTAYARCARIVRTIEADLPLNAAAYETDSERALDSAYRQAASLVHDGAEPASALAEALVLLQAPINAFFEAVLVNAEDADVRAARQALVQHIARLPQQIADLSKLQGF